MTPSIQELRRTWHQLGLGTDIEFWDLTPADFKFIVSIKLGTNLAQKMNRTLLSALVNKFKHNDIPENK